jgi:hypothetical protein
MKTSRAFALAAATLAVGFFAARWSNAQPQPAKEPVSYDFGALQQLTSFLTYLQDTKQTNTLQRFNDYSNASLASQHYADLGVTLTILRELREGRTNQALDLLEGNLDAGIVGFATSYRELPASVRDQTSLKVFSMARDYRAKYPSPLHMDDDIAGAFKILDGK